MRSPRPSHPRSRSASLALLAAIGMATAAHAQTTYYKANNTTSLTSAGSWWLDDVGTTAAVDAPVNTTTPTATCIWNNVVTGANTIALVDVGIQNLVIRNPGGPVTLDAGSTARTMTVANNGGIDMSQATQDLTLQNMFYRAAASGANLSLKVAEGRTLTFGSNAQLNVRSSAGNVTININPDTTNTGTVKFGANFGPTFMVVHRGRAELTRSAGNTRIGTNNSTTVNSGTLYIGNTSGSATGTGPVTVNSTGTLTGAGIISGAVTVADGATIAPGENAIGTLTVGSLTLATGSTIVWEANNAAEADRIGVTGTDGLVINGGTLKLYQPGTTTPFAGTGVFTLFTQVGAIGGAGLSALTIDESTKIPGRSYTLSQGAGVVNLVISDGSLTNHDWAVDAAGDWSVAGNWSGGVPDSASSIARITGSGATLSAPRTVTLDSARTVQSLVLDSAQTVTLAGSSALTLNGGGAAAGLNSSNADHVVSTPLTLTTGGVLASVEGAGNSLTLSGVISGDALGLVKTGNGTLLLTADNAYTGATAVSTGVLQIGTGGASGSVAGAISVSSGATVRYNRSGSSVISSAISGGGSVDFAGTGDTTLQTANTFSGSTTIAAGTLIVGHAQALQNSTLNYASTGGAIVIADPITALTLGGLTGDRSLPLTNSIGTPIALTVGGNNGSTTYSASPLGTGVSFTKNGTGNLTLTGNHSYTGNTVVNGGVLSIAAGSTFNTAAASTSGGGTARITVSGGTLNASAASTISNVTAGLLVSGGTANFNGGLANETGSSSGNITVSVTGGALNASSISLSRGGLSITSEPANGQTANGLYVNGGAVHVTGSLGLGSISGANSSVSGRIDSGSLTVDGAFTVGINNTARWSVFDANGGVVTVNDTTNGLLLGGAYAGQVIMHVRGSSVVNVPRIQFGQGALAGRSILNLGGGALYVGSGGLVLGSTEPTFVSEVRLGSGTLGASGDWSSPIPVQLSGFPSVVTGADASDTPHTVTLSGAVTGVGGLRKAGAGTVLFTNSANVYSDAITVEGGTLGLAGTASFGITVNSGGNLAPQGVLSSSFGATIDGGLAIRYDGTSTVPVPRLESGFTVTLGAASSLVVSGTGSLPGPAYAIIKGPVSGTFGTVSLPEGLTLDYAYDDDNDAGTPTVVALLGSITAAPYDAWTASYSLSGANALASADPDNDGFANLIEFAFSSSPVAANGAPWTVARSGNFLTLDFSHPANSGLTYSVEATNDLSGTWTTVHTFPAFTTAANATYTDTVDLSTAGARRFLRLKITAAP